MADAADDPRPPRPPMPPPGQPLPRIHRSTLPPEDDPPAKPRKKKGSKAAKDPDEKRGVLEEQTPKLDTYEARQRIRMVVGGVMLAGLAGVLFLVFGRIGGGGGGPEPVSEDEAPVVAGPAQAVPRRVEREAGIALADAYAFAKRGDGDLALRRLTQLVEAYPKTAAAEKARESIRNAEQGLPLFVNGPVVVAKAVTPPEPAKEAPPEVVAVAPEPPAPPGPAPVQAVPPPVPPEPYRETGLPREPAQVEPRPLPVGFRARVEAGVHASGWPWEITCDQDGAAMVLVPGGTFLMGRNDGAPPERPVHRVTLSPYYIDQHEVTVRQYALFLKARGHRASVAVEGGGSDSEELPVVRVSARDAFEYARWAGKTMPTEAQWELAARTIDGRLHPWGPGLPAWGRERKPGRIDPVMSFALDMSPYGVFDLAGNAREWVLDWYDPRYYQQSKPGAAAVDPINATRPKSKLPEVTVKGGSPEWVVTWRTGLKPDTRLPDLGFRGVLQVERGAGPAPAAGGAPGQPAAPPQPAGRVPF